MFNLIPNFMKKIALMIMASALFAVSCDPNLNTPKTAEVTIRLTEADTPLEKADVTIVPHHTIQRQMRKAPQNSYCRQVSIQRLHLTGRTRQPYTTDSIPIFPFQPARMHPLK